MAEAEESTRPPADYFSRPAVVNNSIYSMLLNDIRGKVVITGYSNNGYLVKVLRNRLSRVIIGAEAARAFDRVHRVGGVKQLKEFKILRAQFIQWSEQIEEVFPGENALTYYTPFRYIDREKFNATGALIRHYEYLLGTYRKDGILLSSKQSEPEGESIPEASEASFQWLQANVGPDSDLKAHWRNSFRARQQYLVEHPSVSEYFALLPCLKTSSGPELLKADFSILFPHHRDFLRNWQKGRNTLIRGLKQCKAVPIANRGALQTLEGLQDCDKDSVIIDLLPYLIDPPAPKRKLKEKRLTAEERKEAFLVYVEKPADIVTALNRVRSRLDAAESSFSPMPVFGGPIAQLSEIYVYLTNPAKEEPIRYRVEFALDAIDLCFKCHFALQCKYQLRAQNVWLLLQRGFYGIDRRKDRCNQSINVLLGQLRTPLTDENEDEAEVENEDSGPIAGASIVHPAAQRQPLLEATQLNQRVIHDQVQLLTSVEVPEQRQSTEPAPRSSVSPIGAQIES